MNRSDLIKIIRRSQTFISIMLFFGVFFFSWDVTGFELTEIQLSKWGETGSIVESIWNSAVCLLSISILFNSIYYLKNNNRIKYKTTSYVLFSLISICLFVIGFFNVNHNFIHNLAAYLYFFIYPFSIFIFAHLNRKTLHYKDWIQHVVISISMMVLPLIFISLFNGMALAEMTHILFVVIWNLKIAFKSINDE